MTNLERLHTEPIKAAAKIVAVPRSIWIDDDKSDSFQQCAQIKVPNNGKLSLTQIEVNKDLVDIIQVDLSEGNMNIVVGVLDCKHNTSNNEPKPYQI
jgi:hypothetical protein